MNTFLIAIFSIMLSVAAQFSLKAGMASAAVRAAMAGPFSLRTPLAVLFQPAVFLGFALYGLGAVVWLAVLSKWDVSRAYPMVGLGFALTVGIGFLIGEQVTPARAAGVAMICAGVFLAGRV
ncbi:MAG: hypothetical protein KGN34_08575 [Sphingomonadales bacterium]|nr:hypothetical protein [Sphingomonadales bacterium]